MDAAVRRRGRGHSHFVERWSRRLPAAYFTRIVLAEVFERPAIGEGGPLHVIGRDRAGEPCYCHFSCEFECPRCFPVRPRRRGEQRLAIVARELRGWRLKAGNWLICVVDREHGGGAERVRYATRTTMPGNLCLDSDMSE